MKKSILIIAIVVAASCSCNAGIWETFTDWFDVAVEWATNTISSVKESFGSNKKEKPEKQDENIKVIVDAVKNLQERVEALENTKVMDDSSIFPPRILKPPPEPPQELPELEEEPTPGIQTIEEPSIDASDEVTGPDLASKYSELVIEKTIPELTLHFAGAKTSDPELIEPLLMKGIKEQDPRAYLAGIGLLVEYLETPNPKLARSIFFGPLFGTLESISGSHNIESKLIGILEYYKNEILDAGIDYVFEQEIPLDFGDDDEIVYDACIAALKNSSGAEFLAEYADTYDRSTNIEITKAELEKIVELAKQVPGIYDIDKAETSGSEIFSANTK
ncbi:hypothetical protein HOD08_01190 [bacterium]|nr:hypothetical protein [bacterium]